MASNRGRDAALVDWANTCKLVSPQVTGIEDLADGVALGALLHYYVPDKFSAPPATVPDSHLETLCLQLDTHFKGKLAVLIASEADTDNISSETEAVLDRLCGLVEAVLLAAVEGPRKDDAIAGILSLDEVKQGAIKFSLQNVMAKFAAEPRAEQPAASAGYRARRAGGGKGGGTGGTLEVPPKGGYRDRRKGGRDDDASPRGGGGGGGRVGGARARMKEAANRKLAAGSAAGSDSNDGRSARGGGKASQEARELRNQYEKLESRCDQMRSTERSVCNALSLAKADYHHEEALASEGKVRLSAWNKAHGQDVLRGATTIEHLQQEIENAREDALKWPQQEAELSERLDEELIERNIGEQSTEELEAKVKAIASARERDDTTELNKEVLARQMITDKALKDLKLQERTEQAEGAAARYTWEKLCDIEVSSRAAETDARTLGRAQEHEEECERDSVGILEFRESELRQVEMAMDDAMVDNDEMPMDGLDSMTGSQSMSGMNSYGGMGGGGRKRGSSNPMGAAAHEDQAWMVALTSERKELAKELKEATRSQNQLEAMERERSVKSNTMEQQLKDMQDKIINRRFRTDHCEDIEHLKKNQEWLRQRKDSVVHHVDAGPWHAAVQTEEAAILKLRAEIAAGSEELDAATNAQHDSDTAARDEVGDALKAEALEEQRVLDARQKVNDYHAQTQRSREAHQLAAKITVEQEEKARRAKQAEQELKLKTAKQFALEEEAQKRKHAEESRAMQQALDEEERQNEGSTPVEAGNSAPSASATPPTAKRTDPERRAVVQALLLKDQKILEARRKEEERKDAHESERELLVGVLHEIGLRYHQLLTRHRANVEIRENRQL